MSSFYPARRVATSLPNAHGRLAGLAPSPTSLAGLVDSLQVVEIDGGATASGLLPNSKALTHLEPTPLEGRRRVRWSGEQRRGLQR